MNIAIEYKPITPVRKDTTLAITNVIRNMAASPVSPNGHPPSFVLEKKYTGAVHVAAKDAGVAVSTRKEGDNIRVFLRNPPPLSKGAPDAPAAPAENTDTQAG
ncbi:MAG: hypothetical protein LBK99_24170 [Opitutaceae bacterium]|jgi:hypothetical protein|nr:hypothetical protein [Opitutaceae bacterium]